MLKNTLNPKVKEVLRRIAPLVKEENFYLAGGTGLALQISHRISDDLDFFRDSPFHERNLLAKLKDLVPIFEEVLIEKHSVLIVIGHVRCSFYHYDVPLIDAPSEIEGIKVAHWPDILAEKFKTVSQRGSKKDFYDIWAIIKLKNISIAEAISYLPKRFGSGINKYHILRSLTYFEDAEGEPDPVCLGDKKFSWPEVKAFFLENIKAFEKALLAC